MVSTKNESNAFTFLGGRKGRERQREIKIKKEREREEREKEIQSDSCKRKRGLLEKKDTMNVKSAISQMQYRIEFPGRVNSMAFARNKIQYQYTYGEESLNNITNIYDGSFMRSYVLHI